MNNAVYACDMTAIPPDERGRHAEVVEQLFARLNHVAETPTGFVFSLSPEPATLLLAAEFISRECRCCPFFGFALELAPHGAALRLRVDGEPGVKAFILAEFGSVLPPGVTVAGADSAGSS
jgi:hypothetical protein